MKKIVIALFCSLIAFINAGAKIFTIDSPDFKYRVLFEDLKNKSASALWLCVAENPGPKVHFLSFMQVDFILTNGTTISAHDISDNNLSGGHKFFLNLSDNEAFQLTHYDIKEITLVGLLGNTTFELKSGSADILKKLGIQSSNSSSSSSSKPSTSTTKKPAPATQSNPTSAKISKVTIQKGLIVNGEPSIQVDVNSILKNFKGRKLHFELFFCNADGKNIVNDGDAVDKKGNKYFRSQDFIVNDDNLNTAWWWKVYLKRLNIPRGATKIYAFVSVNDENGTGHGSIDFMTINLNSNTPDVYTKP